MSFEVKFQVQIKQKCRSKWNDIGHTLELGFHLAVSAIFSPQGPGAQIFSLSPPGYPAPSQYNG